MRTALTLIIATLPLSASAAHLIRPDTAAASTIFNANFKAENTINGSGLPANFTPSSPHADYSAADGGNHWTTADSTTPLTAHITFGFTAPQTLTTFYMWNHRSNIISSNPGYDVTLFDLTLLAADGTTVLRLLDNVPALPDVATAQTFTFPLTTNVSFVRLDVESVQSSTNYTGLAEVAFASVIVPEPASLALLTLPAAALLRRRK